MVHVQNSVHEEHQKHLQNLARAVEANDLTKLRAQLAALDGANISHPLVQVTLPRHWHTVASRVLSSPMRAAISYGNTDALTAILQSNCHVTDGDKSDGMQKILRHADTESGLEIIRLLVASGASVQTPLFFTLPFQKTLQLNEGICRRVVQVCCQADSVNSLKGHLLLSVALSSDAPILQCGNRLPNWQSFAKHTMKSVFESNFDPRDFTKKETWISMGNPAFRRLIYALPALMVASRRLDEATMGALIRRIASLYPLQAYEGKAVIKVIARLMWETGYPMKSVLSVACPSPRFTHATGFDHWSTHNVVRSMKDCCKLSIRESITSANLYAGIEGMPCIPTTFKDLLLLRDVHNLPWEKP